MTYCEHTDAILAQFLDGEGPTDGLLSASALAEHLEQCPHCGDQLARARRLDAMVAASAERRPPEGSLANIWEGFEAATAEPIVVTPPSRWRRAVTAAALLAAGFTVALLIDAWFDSTPPIASSQAERTDVVTGPETTAEPVEPTVESPATEPENGTSPDNAILLPETRGLRTNSARRRTRASRPASSWTEIQRLESTAMRADLPEVLEPMVQLRAHTLGLSQTRTAASVAATCADDVRAHALDELLRSPHPRAFDAAVRILDDQSEGTLLDRMVTATREHETTRRRLVRRAQSRASTEADLTVAAMVGGSKLDRALRIAAQGDLERAEWIATASARVFVRPDRTQLLLNLWADVQERGLERPNEDLGAESAAEDRASRWFGSLPHGTTGELIAVARETNRAQHRRRCLLALAARGDRDAWDYLLELVHGRNHDDALLAGFALSRLPATDLSALLRELARARRPELLCAAMTSAGAANRERLIERLDVSDEEQKFLTDGAFSLDDFATAASLFRTRTTTPTY